MRGRGGSVRAVPDVVAAEAARRERAHAGDRARRPGRRGRVPAQAVHDHRGRGDRAVLPARLLRQARVGRGVRIPHRRAVLGRGRVHRHERRRALERPDGRSGPRGPAAGLQGRVPRRLGDRAARRRARPPRRGGLLLGAHRLDREQPAVGGRRPHRARVRRLAHLGLRPSRRWHLHEGGRRRRGSRREDRGRDPGGRPAQPGRDRGQRRRQRGRLRRHGGRPVRDVRRHRRRRDAARDRLRADGPLALPAGARRHLDPLVRDRDVLHPRRERPERDHQRALSQRDRRDDPLGTRVHPGDDGVRRWRVRLLEPLRLGAHRPGRDVPARRDHRVLHGDPLEAGEGHREGVADGPRDEHHRRARRRHAGDGATRDRHRDRDRRRLLRRGREPLRHRSRGDGAALDGGTHRRARRVRPGDGQRRRNRGDGRPSGVGARDHRSARRRRQHDEGGHEGLCDRLGRSGRVDPLRRVRAEPRRERARHGVLTRQPLGHRRPVHRRAHALPLRLARDAGGRPRRRPGRRGGAPPVPRGPGDHGAHLAARLLARDLDRHGLGDQGDDGAGAHTRC